MGLPGYQISAISRAITEALARRSTCAALLNSVPRLNQGLLLLRRFYGPDIEVRR